MIRGLIALSCALCVTVPAVAGTEWSAVDAAHIADDDISRHRDDAGFFEGLAISESKFSEAGFEWDLIRYVNSAKPDGPLWMVPHDDENAAFEAVIGALRQYGGVAITVNSSAGSQRNQKGSGTCGGRPGIVASCDPNRNFSTMTPLYTNAFLDQRPAGQPVIALHTNKPGFGGDGDGGSGHISMFAVARNDGFMGNGSVAILNNPDTFGLMSYRAGSPVPPSLASCRAAMNGAGVNVWQERVGKSDGSMSNYLILNQPDIQYFNAESREEADLAVASARHALMISAFMQDCATPPKAP